MDSTQHKVAGLGVGKEVVLKRKIGAWLPVGEQMNVSPPNSRESPSTPMSEGGWEETRANREHGYRGKVGPEWPDLLFKRLQKSGFAFFFNVLVGK